MFTTDLKFKNVFYYILFSNVQTYSMWGGILYVLEYTMRSGLTPMSITNSTSPCKYDRRVMSWDWEMDSCVHTCQT